MLPTDGVVHSLLCRFHTTDVGAGTVCLCHTHHVNVPHAAAYDCHDVAHVGAAHGDAVANLLEAVEHQRQQVHPFLGGDGVLIIFPQITVRCSTKHTNVHFVQCEVAVRDRQQVDCCTGANGLWIWLLRDGDVVPACNMALIEGEPASECDTHLPPTDEAIFEHEELLVGMRRPIGAASFLVCINLVSFFITIPIIVEMKTGVDLLKGILWHALHASADCVKQLACQPSMLN